MKALYKTITSVLIIIPVDLSQTDQSNAIKNLTTTSVIYVPGIMGSPLYDDINNNNHLVVDEKAWFGPRFFPNMLLANNGTDPGGNFNIKVAPLRNDAANTLRDELNTIPMDLFKGFFDNLEANGYLLDDYDDNHTEGENLFCFAYDWRKNNTANAQLLSDFIDNVLLWTGTDKVNLVGHSMGGIVAKQCINLFDKARIDKMVFIGTPHLGAPEALTVMLKGKLFEWLNFVNEIEWTTIRLLARNYPSCYQVIPSSSHFDLSFNNGVSDGIETYLNCLKMPNGNYANYPELINYLEDYQSCIIEDLNDGLLNSSEVFKETIDTIDFGDVKVFNIVGCNRWTIGKNQVIQGGFPTYCNTIEYSRNLNGDFTVPVRSAELINNQVFEHTYYIPDIIHCDLPASQPVLEILLGVFEDPPITYFPQYANPPASYSSITDVVNETEIKNSFYLLQNFPNPFNPITCLKYAIGSRQFVTIKVYDLLGNEITTVINEEKPSGIYEVDWNASGLPSGVYFYQIKAGNFIQTKKMVYLK